MQTRSLCECSVSNTLRSQGLKSCSARRVPLLKPVHVQARLKFAREHLDDPKEDWENVLWSDETKIELFGRNTILVFGGERMLNCIHRTPCLLLSMAVETSCFGAVFLLREQDD